MDLKLAGKRVLISGSTQGIGYAVAASCLAEGAEVIVNGRTAERVDSAVEKLRGAVPGGSVFGVAADFSDATGIDALLGEIGAVDVLVNNVGTFDVAEFPETTDDEWLRYFQVNVMAGVRLSRRFLPSMIESGWGRIIFVGTESAVDVPGNMIPYGATKAASLAVSNGLAKLTRGTGVTVNTVLGGPTYSDGVANVVEQIAAAQSITTDQMKSALVRPTSLVQRFLEPTEIANLVTYLASPLSSATNGAALRADGGVLPTIV
ncbi:MULTISPECIES: SDR family NAD(P)-dependent oxidoreductase [unclassified Microbacterium]|uniref:SDR family NAD(P)-dependent oxidoreductase n=1 Tax=unclassified Microbacterium TaxID=2609290 RepID=UPI000EAAC9D1|nr:MULTISPECIES: SDR family NAD(P)-dependent oxidoreductase [unclassified Microbacterium]MBT2484720.1 SDR family NAD(P)-dependent oxidoreductase [Microbacterium sp. ISL-108]RKN67604.1 SDR family NAD(P)-dependent oxidoreductase [Microbacterium sp. CGR2]